MEGELSLDYQQTAAVQLLEAEQLPRLCNDSWRESKPSHGWRKVTAGVVMSVIWLCDVVSSLLYSLTFFRSEKYPNIK